MQPSPIAETSRSRPRVRLSIVISRLMQVFDANDPGPAPRAPASYVRTLIISAPAGGGLGAEQALDDAALVHGSVALGGLIEGQLKVEDPAGIDRTVPDQAEQIGQEPAYRRGTAEQVHLGVEQLL